MKNKIKENIKIGSVLVGFLFGGLLIGNSIYNSKIENKMDQKLKNLKFTEGTYLEGLEINYEKLTCSGLISKECEIKGLNLAASEIKRNILNVEKTILKPKISDGLNIEMELKNIKLDEQLRKQLFDNYEEKEYVEIGKKINEQIFPIDLNVKIDVDKKIDPKDKTELAEGNISFNIKNKIINLGVESNVFIKNKEFDETIDIKLSEEVKDKELKGEMKSMDVPYYSKVNNFKYTIQDLNLEDITYNLYLLGIKNTKSENEASTINQYFLGDSASNVFTKEEFKQKAIKGLEEYANFIPEDESEFKQIMERMNKLVRKDIRKLEIYGENIGNVSMEKVSMLFLIDNINTTKRYLNESFKLSYKEEK